jgi:hypothetical protein
MEKGFYLSDPVIHQFCNERIEELHFESWTKQKIKSMWDNWNWDFKNDFNDMYSSWNKFIETLEKLEEVFDLE